jgi:hypothetical protein
MDYPEDPHTLSKACLNNKTWYYICQQPHFWKRKIELDFGPEVAQLKPVTESYQDQYWYLVNIEHPDKAAEDGRMDALLILKELPTSYGASLAEKNGHQKIVNRLIESGVEPQIKWMSVTGNPYLDKEILMNKNFPEIMGTCANPMLNYVCQSDYFWYQKVRHEFGPEVTQFKPPKESFRNYYHRKHMQSGKF